MSWEEGMDETEFNGNTASLMRVDNAIRRINDADLLGDPFMKFKFLKVLMKEALYKMYNRNGTELKDRKITMDKYKELESDVNYLSRHKTNRLVLNKTNKSLDDFDIHLRDFIGKKGMLLKDAPDMSGL